MTTQLDNWKYGRTKGFIKRNTLRKDIRRGVRFLSDSAYSEYSGVTKISALFVLELKKLIDLKQVYRVDFKYSQKHNYSVWLFSKQGFVIKLKGFSFGYYGEGSRGSLALLQEIGFNEKQIHRIFTTNDNNGTTLRMYRRVK